MLETIKIEEIIKIAQEAGAATMEIYQKDFSVEYKDDKSPLTEADLKANKIICDALTKLYPDIPILSEENKAIEYSERKDWEYYWCIDPIDGTKEFIKKNGEFTINIALIHQDSPVAGVVYAPALNELYYAKRGEGAFKMMMDDECLMLDVWKLPLEKSNVKNSITIVASKSHLSAETQEFIDNLTSNIQHSTLVSKGSSLKLCMVAEGEADIYPRLAPTMEWDTAAADAIVREAGKMTYQFESQTPLLYNKEDLLNPWFVVK
ncbi:MAG: 3'(2'),5'-bisphosphate nucleotidase CysQ [Campylobacterales bacterium]|nr:3'(2'),5'-bisphosphate nucleotidase CysQ [Campylobacterales bacterium]